ncbi:hypothetical protein M3231_15290 [Neobacillus mesonae]|nr:hypothetical protein [Neobacillus mesonae]
MTKAQLIEALAQFPDNTEVYVWEGYDAGVMTTNIDVRLADGIIVMESAT